MPRGMPRGTSLRRLPRTKTQDLAIREEYGRGDTLITLQQRHHRGRIMLNSILGLTPATRLSRMSPPTTITPVVQDEASSLVQDFVRGFETRVVEFHTIIAERTQERDEARKEVARLRTALTTAINGTKSDLEQLQAAGKRVSSPLLSPLDGG